MSDDGIAEFWAARLDEVEAAARATAPSGTRYQWRTDVQTDDDERTVGYCVISHPDVSGVAGAWGLERGTGQQVAEHIALHNPARVLRDVAADRAILAEHAQRPGSIWCRACDPATEDMNDSAAYSPCRTVRHRVAVHSDHPGYRPEWKP